MFKERIFRKKITIQNFKLIDTDNMNYVEKTNKGKLFKKDSELVAQVFYTPKGYVCEVEQFTPLDTWDSEQYCKIEGVSDESPEGDLLDKNFDTLLAAMHFITRRLKRLGWEPLDGWCDA